VAASQFRASARQQSIAAELSSWTAPAQLVTGDIAEQVTERVRLHRARRRLERAMRDAAQPGRPDPPPALVRPSPQPVLYVPLEERSR
jgi:hypothetical protein